MNFISLPFTEWVGVGSSARYVVIENYEDLRTFLRSDDFLYCFSNTSMDLSNLATMFNIYIGVYTFSSSGTMNPVWHWIHPNPDLVWKSPFKTDIGQLWLYHENNVHYNLLVPRHLCSNEPQSEETQKTMPESESLSIPEVNLQTAFSPMEFMLCPRGAGRPKKVRFGEPNNLSTKQKLNPDENDNNSSEPHKKKRGRPAGSKNKPKEHNIRKLTMREKAENAALNIIESNDVCPICFITWSDPINAGKAVTRCETCGLKCHEH